MSTSISRIANVIIPTADQDQAVRFYTVKLGLEKRVDAPFGPGLRWIEIAPMGADTSIAICPPGPGVTPGGKDTGISLATDDVEVYHAHLTAGGVDVDPEVSRSGEGAPPLFWRRDPEGNVLLVVEAR